MTPESRIARRHWQGNLNNIPVELAYDFELQWIAANDPADGFHGSAARVAEAIGEINGRKLSTLVLFAEPMPIRQFLDRAEVVE